MQRTELENLTKHYSFVSINYYATSSTDRTFLLLEMPAAEDANTKDETLAEITGLYVQYVLYLSTAAADSLSSFDKNWKSAGSRILESFNDCKNAIIYGWVIFIVWYNRL